MSATGKMPPLPSLDPTTVGLTPEEERTSRLESAPSGLPNEVPFEKSFMAQQIGTAHAARMAEANRHYQGAQTYFEILSSGKNPNTGAALSDEEKANYQQMLDGAWDDLSKVAGLDKDTKKELEQRKQMMDTVLLHGHDRVGQMAQALADQAAPSNNPAVRDRAAQAGVGNLPAPPVIPAATPLIGAPGQAQPPGAGNLYNSPPGLIAPLLAQTTQPAAIARGETQQNVEAAHTAGIPEGTRDYAGAVLEHKLPPIPSTITNNYIDPNTDRVFNGVVEKGTGNIIDPSTGKVVPGAVKADASAQAAPTPYPASPTERPYGVKRNNETLMPGDPKFTDADAKLLKASQDAYDDRQKLMTKRSEDASDRYALMRLKGIQYNVWDKQDGTQHYVNANAINMDPDRYMQGSGGQVLANRSMALTEIKNSTTVLDNAVNALTDADWDNESRVALATALRAPDPMSAQSAVINALAAGHLTKEQSEYVLAILNAQESVMRIGVVAGLGAGATNQMRDAVTAMLPSGVTPNKAWAQRQLALVRQQFDIFGSAIPSMEGMGLHPPTNVTPATGTPAATGAAGAAGAGAATLTPPRPAGPNMKWQHRTVNGKTEWKEVPAAAGGR